MKSQLDIIIFKRESFDSDTIQEIAQEYSPNHKIIIFDKNEVRGYFKFFRLPAPYYYWFFPIAFVYDNLMIFGLFLYLCLRYQVKTIHMETYSAAFVGILRRLGLCKRLIYVTTDWFVKDKSKGFWNGIGAYLFKKIDRIACWGSDVILNYTCQQYLSRMLLSPKEKDYIPKLKLLGIPFTPRHLPIFIGEVRKDSGIELIRNVKIIRYEKREELPGLLSDGLCGMNVITENGTCSRYTIPSKIMDYLQHGLPVIVTRNVGDIFFEIEKHKLGYIVEPNKKNVTEALKKCYMNQRELTENVVQYIMNRKYTRLENVWKTPTDIK